MRGPAALARATGAPLVPLALWGTQRLWSVDPLTPGRVSRPRPVRHQRVDVAFGEALHVTSDDDLIEATTRLGHALTALLEGLQAHPDHAPAPGQHAPWHPAHLGGHAPDRARALGLDSVPKSAVPPNLGSTYDAQVSVPDPQAHLVEGLGRLNEQVLAKLDGLSEYDLRRPMTSTGTNLLGLVKHLASVQAGYLGETFGRPFPGDLPFDDDDPQLDLYATADETSDSIKDFYRASWRHALETLADRDLDSVGRVPWWSDPEVSLHQILVHMTTETARHAGHLDIVRELIDGAVGRAAGDANIVDGYDWPAYVEKLEALAREADSTP